MRYKKNLFWAVDGGAQVNVKGRSMEDFSCCEASEVRELYAVMDLQIGLSSRYICFSIWTGVHL